MDPARTAPAHRHRPSAADQERRRPERTVLHQVVSEHWAAFVEHAAEQGRCNCRSAGGPAPETSATSDPARTGPPPEGTIRALDILLIAPDEPTRAATHALLVARAHRVALASTAADEARSLVEAGARFDVLVVGCDLGRRREGLLLADELLEAEVIARVVVLLARSDITAAMRARDLGTFVRLDKPDTTARLLAAVERDDRG